MPAQNAEGIILRKYYLRETSYILVVFTKEFGKIQAVLKGVRKPYPQFAGNFEPITRCSLLFYRKQRKQLDLITECSALDPFLAIRKDIEKLTYANYFIELVNIATKDHDVNTQLYLVLAECLKLMSKDADTKGVKRIFELKFLEALGLSPRVDQCIECGETFSAENSFNVKSGGILCAKCSGARVNSPRVSMGTINFIRKVQSGSFEYGPRIGASGSVAEEVDSLLESFMKYHINYPVKSLKFIEELRRVGIA